MLPPKGAKGAMVTARSQKQGKTGWLFGLCVVMAILVLIAGCEKKAPKRQSAPLTAPLSVSAAATTPPPATAALAITEAATPAAALPTTSPDGTPVEESLPWQGMPAELLDKTGSAPPSARARSSTEVCLMAASPATGIRQTGSMTSCSRQPFATGSHQRCEVEHRQELLERLLGLAQ